jgi:DNA repair photolyase
MNDNDLTDLLEKVASDYWDSRIFLDGREPWSEQPAVVKNELKEAIVPWIFRAAPLLVQKADEEIKRLIGQARELGVSDKDIIDHLLSVPTDA